MCGQRWFVYKFSERHLGHLKLQQQFTVLPIQYHKNLKNLKTFYKLQIALHKHLELKSTAQVKIKRFSILLSALEAALKNETAWELGLKSSCEQVSNKILTYTYLSNQF